MEPEKLVSSQSVFQGKIVNVRSDTVLLPSGRQTVREVVEHSAAVVIVPIDSDDNVLLVRQYRYPIDQFILEAPAGGLEDGESPDDCAQRELQEEVGYASRNIRPMGGFWSAPGFSTEYLYAYMARDLVPSKLNADDDEAIEVIPTPMSSINKLIRLGEIQDSKTIAALLMATIIFEKS
ncbi:MAG: NUDIX hydrolase [Chloroflexi bacterium]|nr:NUDIX hydrolase [Chloroflexota bacterium]MDA1227981.1 NUDIX hydrolase [Chloroflexota bacterium]